MRESEFVACVGRNCSRVCACGVGGGGGAQHNRTRPTLGVTLSVRTLDDLGELHTSTPVLEALLGMAVQYACGVAQAGSILITAEPVTGPTGGGGEADAPRGGPGSPCVLFTVSCAGRRQDAEAVVFDAPAGSPAAARVGLGSLVPGMRGPVEDALRSLRSSGGGGGAANERTYTLMRSAADVRLVASLELARATDARLALATAAAQAAPLDAHIGVATFITEAGTITRFWLLLPRRAVAAAEVQVQDDAVAGVGRTVHAGATVFPAAAAMAAAAVTVTGASAAHEAHDVVRPMQESSSARAQGPAFDVRPLHERLTLGRGAMHRDPPLLDLEPPDGPGAITHVMLVDDEVTLRRLGTRMLAGQNVACDALADGSEVAGALTPAHELLLLDIVMRQSDGVQVRARRAEQYKYQVVRGKCTQSLLSPVVRHVVQDAMQPEGT
jgi:hypothetical protein